MTISSFYDESDALLQFNCEICRTAEIGCTLSRMRALPPKLGGKRCIMPPSAAKSLPPRTCCSPLGTSCCPPKLSFRPQQQQRPAQYRCPSFPWSDRRLRDEPMMLERCALWSRENVKRIDTGGDQGGLPREGGSPKLEIKWRRRHKVWR